MSLLTFILYSLIAYLVIRFVARLFFLPGQNQSRQQSGQASRKPASENLEKPKFTIEAESVDYEVIEETKNKNEE